MLNKKALLAVFFCFFAVCPMLFAQANGSFSGTVTDKTGSVITGAQVKVTSQATGVVRETKSDDSGHYLIPLLPVSEYTLHVDSSGFQAAEQKDIKLQVDEHREVNFTLAPASVTEQVEVSATEVAVQTTNPSLGQVITEQQVAQLPLNGRDFVQLATLTPGTTQETNPNSFFNGGPSSEVSARGSYSLSVGGSRAQSTDWLLDNNDNNELTAGGIAVLPSIDAIQEFKVLTYNYSAEYGTRAGPTVLVSTKSGTNQFHGSVFEFFRNTSLDARSYFAAEREKFNLNQFGAALGGPIQKDKTFFFVDYQGKRQRRGVPFVGLVPTPAMLTGNFNNDPYGNPRTTPLNNPFSGSPFQCAPDGVTPLAVSPTDGTQASGVPCSVIPSALINPIARKLINLYPLSNTSNPSAGFNYDNVPVRSLNEDEYDARLDHNFSTKDSLFARFSYDQAASFVPGGAPGFAEQNAFGSTQRIFNHARNAAISETHIFSDRNINQFNVGYNRIFNYIYSFGYGSCESSQLGIPNANLDSRCNGPAGVASQSSTFCVSCGLTSIQLSGGYFALGDRGFAPFQGGTNVYSISDSLDMIRGAHNVRVGMGIRANQMNVMTNAFQDGYYLFFGGYTGDAMADLLMGMYGGAIHDQTFKGATTGRRWKLFRPYVQDDWRVTPNLTLNLGLAWALVTPITEAHNRMANFVFATGQYLVPGQNADSSVGVQFDKSALEPRIGLAWKVFGSQNTALRAGYAIFHDSSWNQGAVGLWEAPPFFAESDNFPGACPFGSPASTCSISGGFPVFTAPPDINAFTGTVQSQNLNFKQGRVQQFNVNVEHQLPGDLVITAGYAGSRSSHLLMDGLNLNVASPSACGTVANYTLGCGIAAAPYPFFYISNINDSGSALYNSLQIKAETKNARHGLYALVGYTYSHTYDSGLPDNLGTGVGATYWPLPGASKTDWSWSQINLNHQFTASVIYDLPFGKGRTYGGNWSGPVNAVLGNWQATIIEKITSGFPVFVINSNDQSGVAFQDNASNWNRPDMTCNPDSGSHSLTQWFNASCFSAAPVGQLGNAPRAPGFGPDFVNTDFSLIKRFPITERLGMDFRAEFFNIFNHAQFGTPNADIATAAGQPLSSNFGIINSTVNNPRLVQFALKLTF